MYIYINIKYMLITSLTLLLLSNVVSSRRDKSILFSRTALLILFYCFILLSFDLSLIFVDKGLSLFGGLIYCKGHNQIFALFILFLSLIILILTSFYFRKVFIEQYLSLYYIIYFNNIFLIIKLQNYGLYIISNIYRNSEMSKNGRLTYFLIGRLSSCIILL